MNRSLSLVLSLLPLGVGCNDYGPWEDETSFGAIWSDDGSEILVIRHDYQERSVNAGSSAATDETRGDSYELSVTTRDAPDDRQVVASDIPGYSRFYFMKTAGYILVDTLFSDDTSDERDGFHDLATQDFHPLDPDALGWSTDEFAYHELLPSPDGQILAVVEIQIGSDDARVSLLGGEGTSPLFDAVTLPGVGDWLAEQRWTAEGTLGVQFLDDSFEITMEGAVQAAPEFSDSCSATTSSDVNADNELVYADEAGQLTFSEAPVVRTWACL